MKDLTTDPEVGAQAPTTETESQPQRLVVGVDSRAEELAELIARRDRDRVLEFKEDGEPNADFIPERDGDRWLVRGSIVQVGGVDVRLLYEVPTMVGLFRDEAVFAEHLSPANLAANGPYLRNRYNANGVVVGVNEKHPLNLLDARIAQLEEEAAAVPVDETAAADSAAGKL